MDEGSVSTAEDGLTRNIGFFGLLLTSEGSIIGSGWLFGALVAATIGGSAACPCSPARATSWPRC